MKTINLIPETVRRDPLKKIDPMDKVNSLAFCVLGPILIAIAAVMLVIAIIEILNGNLHTPNI